MAREVRIAERYADRMPQLVVRLDQSLLRAVDELVMTGEFDSRSDAVRQGLENLVDAVRRRRIGEEIVAGYLATPQTDEELARMGFSEADTARLVDEEPW